MQIYVIYKEKHVYKYLVEKKKKPASTNVSMNKTASMYHVL